MNEWTNFNSMRLELEAQYNVRRDIDYAYAVQCKEAHLICSYHVLNTILRVSKENNVQFKDVLSWGCRPS